MTTSAPKGPTSRQLELFRAVMRTRGVSAAARSMQMSQPAVSYQLRALENLLGFALFVRERGRIAPTREAGALAIEVERHFVGLQEIGRAAAHLRDVVADQLNVGALPALGFTLMPTVVARFRREFPGVKVSLQTLGSTAIKDAVSTGGLDVGFVASEVDTLGVISSEFATRSAMVVMPNGHRLARRPFVRPRDLRGEPFVALNSEDATRGAVDAAMRAEKVELEIAAETPYALGVCALVGAGVGIGLVNPLSFAAVDAPRLRLVPFRPRIRFKHLLLFPPQPAGRSVRAFVAIARAVLDEQPGD